MTMGRAPVAGGDRRQDGLDLGHDIGRRAREGSGIDDEALCQLDREIDGPHEVALPWTLMGPGVVLRAPTSELAFGCS